MEYNIINQRATLFLSVPQTYDENTMPIYIQALTPLKLMPSYSQGIGIKIKPDGSIQQQNTINLEMKKLDNTLIVTFSTDRIDIVSNRDNETVEEFSEEISPIIDSIKAVYLGKFSRLAQFASIMYKADEHDFINVYKQCFALKADENPQSYIEWTARKVNRTKVGMEPKTIEINNVVSVSRTMVQIGSSNGKDRIIQEIDINTVDSQDNRLVTDLISDFFKSTCNAIVYLIKDFDKR